MYLSVSWLDTLSLIKALLRLRGSFKGSIQDTLKRDVLARLWTHTHITQLWQRASEVLAEPLPKGESTMPTLRAMQEGRRHRAQAAFAGTIGI